jgi:hypothetical protein
LHKKQFDSLIKRFQYLIKDIKDANPHSRRASRPGIAAKTSVFEKTRAQGRPGARRTHGPTPKRSRKGRVTTGTGRFTPAFPARWFTAYFELLVNQLVCHRRSRDATHQRELGACMGRARTTRLRRPRRTSFVFRCHPRPPRPAPRS